VKRVTNHGVILGGRLGNSPAISGFGGADEIKNFGLIAGNISLPGLTNNLYNAPNARIEALLIEANGSVALVLVRSQGLVNAKGSITVEDLQLIAPRSAVADLQWISAMAAATWPIATASTTPPRAWKPTAALWTRP
jgi:hypothetical protein